MKVRVKKVERGVESGNRRSWVTIMYLVGIDIIVIVTDDGGHGEHWVPKNSVSFNKYSANYYSNFLICMCCVFISCSEGRHKKMQNMKACQVSGVSSSLQEFKLGTSFSILAASESQ